MVVLDDLASRVEPLEVTIVGERVALATDRGLELESTKILRRLRIVCGSKQVIFGGAGDSKNPTLFALPRLA